MFAPFIKKELNFLDEYFSLIFKNETVKFPQSIILYGEDLFAQYMLALNLAKLLNCSKNHTFDCDCINCNWIQTNQHPDVITVSKIDFKPESDNSKTVISVAQTKEIKNMLVSSSDNYRVFIICDAEKRTPTNEEKTKIEEFKANGFALPYENETNGKYWIPQGLNKTVFQEECANSLLKSIEEPPPKTAFIFLTQNKNDLIETIISRSQCFYVPYKYAQNTDTSIIAEEFKHYPEINRLEIMNITSRLLNNAEDKNISIYELITIFQEFIKQNIIANLSSPEIVNKMLKDIKVLHKTQEQIKGHIKPQFALENAIYQIFKNWE